MSARVAVAPTYHDRVRLGSGRAVWRVISSIKAGRLVVQAEASGRIEGVAVERVRVIESGCACIYCSATEHEVGSRDA